MASTVLKMLAPMTTSYSRRVREHSERSAREVISAILDEIPGSSHRAFSLMLIEDALPHCSAFAPLHNPVMKRKDLARAGEDKLRDLHAFLPASLSCGDESACNAHPARTAHRIMILSMIVAAVFMAGMLLAQLR